MYGLLGLEVGLEFGKFGKAFGFISLVNFWLKMGQIEMDLKPR